MIVRFNIDFSGLDSDHGAYDYRVTYEGEDLYADAGLNSIEACIDAAREGLGSDAVAAEVAYKGIISGPMHWHHWRWPPTRLRRTPCRPPRRLKKRWTPLESNSPRFLIQRFWYCVLPNKISRDLSSVIGLRKSANTCTPRCTAGRAAIKSNHFLRCG